MLDEQTRREYADYVVDKVVSSGRMISDNETATTFQAALPFCCVEVVRYKQAKEGLTCSPRISIAAPIGDIDDVVRGSKGGYHDGFRHLYRGSRDGLGELCIEGIRLTPIDKDGIRSEIFSREKQCTEHDRKIFDVLLAYAHNRL